MSLGVLLAGTVLAGIFGVGDSSLDSMEQAAKDPNAVLAELSLGLGSHGEGGSSASKFNFGGKNKRSKDPFQNAFEHPIDPEADKSSHNGAHLSGFGKTRVSGDSSQLSLESEPYQAARRGSSSYGDNSTGESSSDQDSLVSKSSTPTSVLDATGTSANRVSLASLDFLEQRPSIFTSPAGTVIDDETRQKVDTLIEDLQKNTKFKEKREQSEHYVTESQRSDSILESQIDDQEERSESIVSNSEVNTSQYESTLTVATERVATVNELADSGSPKAKKDRRANERTTSVLDGGEEVSAPPPSANIESLRGKKEVPVPKGQLEKLSQDLQNAGIAVSKKSKALEVLSRALGQIKHPKQKKAFLEKVSGSVDAVVYSMFGSEQAMRAELVHAFFPKSSPGHLGGEQAQVVASAAKALNGRVLTALLEEKPVDRGELLTSLRDEAVKRGITETVEVNNLPESATMSLMLLITKQINETPHLQAFKPEVRGQLLEAVPLAIATLQPKLPLTISVKGTTVIDSEEFLGETLIPILDFAQHVALDPADRVEVKAAVHVESTDIDNERFGDFVRAGLGKKQDPDAAEKYKEVMSGFYDQFTRELLGIPSGETTEDFMATPEFTQKLDALSQLSSKDLQQKIDDTAQLAAQGLTLDGKNVTAEKIIIGNFKAEIHPETGLTRRTSSTDRAQILKDDFSIENYFGRLANSSDQVQYPDPDNNASKLMQPSIMTAAHGVVAALHAMVTVRPKLILDAQKAADKKGQDAQRRKEVVGHLGSAFGDLLNQPTEKLLDKTPTTTSLEVQLANYGIKASPDVMAVFAALKRAKTVSAFAKSLAQKIDGVLGLPSPEDLGRGLLDSIGIKADNKSAEEIGKIIAGSVRSSALSQIAKGKNINITLPEPGTVLLNMLKTTKEIPDDLEQVLKKPLSAEGVVFTEMEKQQLKAQVIFGLIQYTKKEKLPVTESGKIDVAKFNVIFNDLANGAYLRLHPTATELPFKNEVEEQPIDLDITKHMPDLILGMKEAIENFAGGDLSKIVKATRAQLLDFAIKYLVVEGIIDQTLEKYTRKYFESVVAGLEGEFLSRLRVGKRLDTFSSVDELLKVIMPSGKKATVALQNTSDASMPPPPPPPPPPPSFGVPGDTGSMPPPPPQSAMNQNAKYALAGSDISIEALDPKGTDRIISQTILVDPLHIFLTFSSLWSEAEKRKELAQIEREREEENAKLIARMAGNLGYLLEGHLHLKQPVVSVAQDESASKDELSGVALRKTASKSSAGTNKSQFKGRDVVSEVEQQRLIKQSQFDRQAYLEDDNRIEKINRDRQELRAILGYSADSLSDDQVRKELEDRGVKSGVSKKQTVSARDSSKALLNASEADKLDPKQIPDMSSVLQGIREGIKLNKSGNDVDLKVTGAQNTATPKKLSSRVKRGLGKHNSSNPVEVQ